MWRRVAAACAAVTAVAAWEASRASLLARSLATDLADSSSFGALGEGKLFQLLRAVSPGAVAGDDAHADVQRTLTEKTLLLLGALPAHGTARSAGSECRAHMGYTARRTPSRISGGGSGVFVDGSAPAGAVLTLYAGVVHAPYMATPLALYGNNHLLGTPSGTTLDGRACANELLADFSRAALLLHPATFASKSMRAHVRNGAFCAVDWPHALGQFVNHAPADTEPNCIFVPLRLSATHPLAQRLPTARAGMDGLHEEVDRDQNADSTETPESSAPAWRCVVAVVALRNVADEELFTNYAYPCGPDGSGCEPWYTPRVWLTAADGVPQDGVFTRSGISGKSRR